METLVEYLTYVKGIGYILVVAFLFAFITFWMLVHTKNKDMIKNVPIVVILWLSFGAAALVSNGHVTNGDNVSPATITAHRAENWLGVNKTEYLAISSGSTARFHKVMSDKVGCKECHHNSGDEIHACKDCHGNPFKPGNLEKPGLKAAIHQKCRFCHKEVFGGPDGCKFCHTAGSPVEVAVPAPARSHTLTWEDCNRCHKDGIPGGQTTRIVYHDFCIKCHTIGIAGASKVPDDHAGRTGDTCKGCHKSAGG